MIKYLIPAILVIIIAFILLFKWPIVDEKNKKKVSLTLLFSTLFLLIALIALLID
tara:strand:+ start:2086 stop:2250 length:165 start_codon:yes stop_codon:yes gene_type:complete